MRDRDVARGMLTLALAAGGCGSEAILTTVDDFEEPADSRPDFDTDAGITPPVAVCQAQPATVAPGEAVRFEGENSFDPDGSTLIDYRWQLALKPDGSRARLPSGAANVTEFRPDVVGQYVATLVVTDESGAPSNACSAELDAAPPQKLYVELLAANDLDDLELVVTRADTITYPRPPSLVEVGACVFEDDDDVCAAKACGRASWGAPGAADDPVVIGDDLVDGTEAIAIDDPADGVYTVGVYDRGTSVLVGDNTATLRVYANGALAWSGSTVLEKECRGATLVQVAFPSGRVNPL
jgi:hypothetical protein